MLPRGYIDEPRPKPEPTPFQGTYPISGCGCLGGPVRQAQRFGYIATTLDSNPSEDNHSPSTGRPYSHSISSCLKVTP